MQGQLAWLDCVARHGFGDELLSQLGALAQSKQPAHHAAAEDVQDHVQVKARPLGRPLELGDVPGPDLVGRRGQQLGLGIGRMGELSAPLARAALGGQQAVHGAHRAEVAALVQQRGVHGRRRGVGKALAVERCQQLLALLRASRANGGLARATRRASGPTNALRCSSAWRRAGAPRHRPRARQAALAPSAGVSSCTPAIRCSRACRPPRAGPAAHQLFFGPRSPAAPCPTGS